LNVVLLVVSGSDALLSQSSYPHGAAIIGGLFVASAGGLVATWYSIASCRFVSLRFFSDLGPLSVLYDDNGAGDVLLEYRNSAGLFSWLRPHREENWQEGSCVGWTETQRAGFVDHTFEAVRVLAIVSVLLSMGIMTWIFLLGCLSMERIYIRLLNAVLILEVTMVGLLFLALRSGLCRHVGVDTECELAEGGLVAIAAAILWFVAFLISVLFVVPIGQDLILVEGELRSQFFERQAARKRRMEHQSRERQERRMAAQEVAYKKEERQRVPTSTPDKTTANQYLSTPGTITMEGDDGEMEVYISQRLDNIESIVDGDDSEQGIM